MSKKRYFPAKKAQLTMFMLLGVFLLGVFGFVWYIGGRSAELQLAGPTEKLITDLMKTGAIPYYVTACLENVSKEAVFLVGQQGGDIFQYEGGVAPNPTRYIPLSYPVTYGISMPALRNDSDYPFPPGYPGGRKRMQQVPFLNFGQEGRFGDVSLRRLCDTYGPNSAFAEYVFGRGGETITHTFCQAPYIYADALSTQWQITQYIKSKVINCSNWTAIREATGYNVTPTGEVNITFRLGLNDVWIDAYIPIEIKVGGREPIYTIGDFHTRLNIRLKRIMELASYLATSDSFKLNFNLSDNSMLDYFSSVWDTNMHVMIDTPMKAAGVWEDIVTIEDYASELYGKSYVFRFARANRYPTLDWLHHQTNWTTFDFILMENDTIVLNPNPPNITLNNREVSVIYDPDEDKLTYYYTGWKSTCDEKFDFDFGIPRIECSKPEPTHPSAYFKFPNQGVSLIDELMQVDKAWKTLPMWIAYNTNSAGDPVRDDDAYPPTMPLAWTSSEEYLLTQRNATYIASHDDIGPHNVTIWVCDEAGLCDFQVVRLMIFDYPQLQLNGSNPYKDIPYDRASVEDFYRLSAEGTTAYYSPLLGYMFKDNEEPFEIITAHPLQILDLPRADTGIERDIRYIHEYMFNRSRLCEDYPYCQSGIYNVSLVHRINLSVTMIDVPPKSMDVTVYQCLPHRNADSKFPWPYQESGVDPYLSTHTCCSPGSIFNLTVRVPEDLEDGQAFLPDEFRDKTEKIRVLGPDGTERYSYGPQLTNAGTAIVVEDGIIKITFSPNDAPGEYQVEQSARIDTEEDNEFYIDYPWGTWMPVSKTCYGGVPFIGVKSRFLAEDASTDPIMGETSTFDTAVSSNNEIYNDITMMKFTRFCSGTRGNICNGIATRILSIVGSCTDLNETKGEIESCKGASPALIINQTPTVRPGLTCVADDSACGEDGKCIDGKCYDREDYMNCVQYPITYQGVPYKSFEQAFNVTRRDGTEPNGTCNAIWTCSDSREAYNVDNTAGQFLLKRGTCEANGGTCSRAITAESKDCNDYNGWSDTSMTTRFCRKNGDHLYTSEFDCKAAVMPRPEKDAHCELNQSSQLDPDTGSALCEACNRAPGTEKITSGATNTYSTNRPNDRKCCGDDLGEGGFPYPTIGTSNIATSTTTANAGKYGNEICDDYYNNDKTKEIDNDCNGLPNCRDSRCYTVTSTKPRPDKGPRGSFCCHATTDCTTALQESNTAYLACNAEKECDCKSIGAGAINAGRQDSNNNPYRSISYTTTFKTCVAAPETNDDLYGDRFVNITGITSGRTYSFSLTTQDIIPGSNCVTNIEAYVFKSSTGSADTAKVKQNQPQTYTASGTYFVIGFKNGLSDLRKDCLVTLTVTQQ